MPLSVADDLDLDVTGALEEPLREDRVVAEAREGLGPGALEGLGQILGSAHPPDAAPAPTGSGLYHEREAEPIGLRARLGEGRHRAPAPGRHGNARLLGSPLRAYLVTERAHHLGRGSDEDHAEATAEFGELGVLRHETPAHPRRLRSALAERALEARVVEVAVLAAPVALVDEGRRAEPDRGVRLLDEERAAVRIGVERDRLEARVVVPLELAHGADESHRRLAAVHDGDAAEVRAHVAPTARRRGSRRSSATTSGRAVVSYPESRTRTLPVGSSTTAS